MAKSINKLRKGVSILPTIYGIPASSDNLEKMGKTEEMDMPKKRYELYSQSVRNRIKEGK